MSAETDLQDAISGGMAVADFLRTEGALDTPNLIGLIEDFIELVGAYQGPRAASALQGMASIRSLYASSGSPSSISVWLNQMLLEYADLIDSPASDPEAIMDALYASFYARGIRVKSRAFTYGAIAAVGSPVGNGVIYTLSKDENDFNIENTFAEDLTFECVFDQNNGGVKFKESFRIRGGASNIDTIIVAGDDFDNTYPGVSSDDTGAFFANASFSDMSGTGTTKFPGWTINTGAHADFTQDLVNYFQITPGDPIGASLSVAGNGSIRQSFARANTQFPGSNPMIIRLPWNRSITGFTGTITLGFGAASASVVAAAQTGWQFLTLAIDKTLWYKNYAQNDGYVTITVSNYAVGAVKFDNFLVAPMIPVDGLWYASAAGSTPFKVGDKFSRSITEVGSILQRFFVLCTGKYLPHSLSVTAITWIDP